MIFEPIKDVRRDIIVDTDIGPDCDDVGALALLHFLSIKYQANIRAIGNCTSNPYGCCAIDVINRYFSKEDIPVGITSRKNFLDEPETKYYNRLLAERFASVYQPVGTKIPENAVSLYKDVLESSADNSILFLTIGTLNNAADLISAYPELVRRKVYAFVTMAGREYDKQKEFNVNCDAASFRTFICENEVPIFYSPVETGYRVMSGFKEEDERTKLDNPLFISYREYLYHMKHENVLQNSSYDLTAVHFAFDGEGQYYKLSEKGGMRCEIPGNETLFETGKGKDYCIELNCPEEELGEYFTAILRNA